MHEERLEPKLWTVIKEGYTRSQFLHDLVAGILVGIVALPLSIALAIASGVKPEQGLITAVVAGFLISVLSGSRHQIGGPTGAFIVLVYHTVHEFGYGGLAVATMMAGALLIALGISRVGTVIKFIPFPVTIGFTSGIAIIILVSQLRDALGLRMDSPPADFIPKLIAYEKNLHTVNAAAVALAALALLIIYLWPRLTRRVPGALVAILVLTPLAYALSLPVDTIGSRFGAMSVALPIPRMPTFPWGDITQLLSPAFAIALLAGMESLLSAVVADGMTGRRHRSNMELIAQGVANLVTPLFGGIPATGAIARTATNIRNGGQTPVAGIVHALTVLFIMIAFGSMAALIPMPVLAAILIKVALDMGEWHLLVRLLKAPRGDVLVLVSTFLLTVFADLALAIEVGVVLAAFVFMHRMSWATQVGNITEDVNGADESDVASGRAVPPDVEVFEINGPFFFGAVDRFKAEMRNVEKPPRVLILRMSLVPTMDATAAHALEDVLFRSKRHGTILILVGVQPVPRAVMDRAGLADRIGAENFVDDIDAALERSRAIGTAAASAR